MIPQGPFCFHEKAELKYLGSIIFFLDLQISKVRALLPT